MYRFFVICTYMVPSFPTRSRLPPLMVVPPAGNDAFHIINRIYERFIQARLKLWGAHQNGIVAAKHTA